MKIFVYLIFSFSSTLLFSQNRDNIWYLGGNSLPPDYLNMAINFNAGYPDTTPIARALPFFITNASICDTNGQMLFYTNGVWVDNNINQHMNNSPNFNPGFATDLGEYGGMGLAQGAIIIPKPGSETQYYIFHVSGEEITKFGNYDVQPLHFSLSEVDMNLDGGWGDIIPGKKNIHIIEDTISQGRITACKHANGIDWWVITHKYYSNIYYKILVKADTMVFTQQYIGSVYSSNDIWGMAVFSPNGDKYVHLQNNDTLELYNFNRCNGELSDLKTLILPDEGYLDLSLGCAFSPGNRFLYVNTYNRVFQFDTWASDVQASIIKVAQWDGTYLPFATYFFLPQAAPDNKIYMSPYAGIFVMHVINSPDSLGLLCDLQQHSFNLFDEASGNPTVPNFPNYDLGPLPGGDTCNAVYTLHYIPEEISSSFRISPNPVSEWLNIIYDTEENGLFQLFDMYGNQVRATSLFHYFKNRLINVSGLPAGVYFATVTQKAKMIWSEKVVVTH